MPQTTITRGYVYLIGSTRFGWYKIGMSRKVEVRIEDLGILLPFRIEVLALWATSNPALVEQMFHEKYAKWHLNGEWFSFSKKKVLELIEAAQPYDARRVYPSARFPSLVSFSNIERDQVHESWTRSGAPAPNVRVEASFKDLLAAFLKENNLEPTKENTRRARTEVAYLFRKGTTIEFNSARTNVDCHRSSIAGPDGAGTTATFEKAASA